jgi:putative hemolysin
MIDTESIVIIGSLLLSAFFSGMEIAFVSTNKIYLELEKKKQGIVPKILTHITESPSKFIATMLVGNNISMVVYGIFIGEMILKLLFQNYLNLENIPLLLVFYQSLISTAIILLIAEFLPKVLFQIYSNTVFKAFVLPAFVFYIIFLPITKVVLWVSNTVLSRYLQTQGDEVPSVFSKMELGNYISEQLESAEHQETLDSEIQIFQNALDFSNVKAREVMVPRAEITSLERYESLQTLQELFVKTGYSKILIYQGNIDNIIGYVHSFDLFKNPKSLRSIILPVEYIPETILAKDVLNILTKKHKSIAVVLDEYGGTAGMITIEDIVEELFGEIEDEHDTQLMVEEKVDQNTFLFSARLEIDYLNDTYRLDLPESEQYETLGGLIVHNTQEIPNQGDLIQIDSFDIFIKEVSNTKINLIELQKTNP